MNHKPKVPREIDTPQAELMMQDLYKIRDFIQKHLLETVGISVCLLCLIGGFFGYRWYKGFRESRAANLVDRGLYMLDNNDTTAADKYFKRAVNLCQDCPSSLIGGFFLYENENNTSGLRRLSKLRNFTVSPAAQAALLSKGSVLPSSLIQHIDRGNNWAYPEAIYYDLISNLKGRNIQEAKQDLEILKGDFKNLPITKLSEELIN